MIGIEPTTFSLGTDKTLNVVVAVVFANTAQVGGCEKLLAAGGVSSGSCTTNVIESVTKGVAPSKCLRPQIWGSQVSWMNIFGLDCV